MMSCAKVRGERRPAHPGREIEWCKAHRRGNGGMPRAERREAGPPVPATGRPVSWLVAAANESQELGGASPAAFERNASGYNGGMRIARGLRAIACGKRSPHRAGFPSAVKSDGP